MTGRREALFADKILCHTEGASSGSPCMHNPRIFKVPAHPASSACDRAPQFAGTWHGKKRQGPAGCTHADIARPMSGGRAGMTSPTPGRQALACALHKAIHTVAVPAEVRVLAAPRASCRHAASVPYCPATPSLPPHPPPHLLPQPGADGAGLPAAHALTCAATRLLDGQRPHAPPAPHPATLRRRSARNRRRYGLPRARGAAVFLLLDASRTTRRRPGARHMGYAHV